MGDFLQLSSLKNCQVRAKKMEVPSNVNGMLIKGISDGTLWFCSYDDVTILCPNGTNLVEQNRFTMTNSDGQPCKITSPANTSVSPVVSTTNVNPCGIPKPEMVQINFDGTKHCVIALGNFEQVTASIHEPNTLYCLRFENYITVFKYMKNNADNKWIHAGDIFPKDIPEYEGEAQEYQRMQIRRKTILLCNHRVIDEIKINSGQFVRRHTPPRADGEFFICCIDEDETAFVVDMRNHGLYILERDSGFTKIKTDIKVTSPHDATICDGKLYVISIKQEHRGESEQQDILYVLEKDEPESSESGEVVYARA